MECTADLIDLTEGFIVKHLKKRYNLKQRFVKREKIAVIIVSIDIFIMFLLLLSQWFLAHYVRCDADRHNKLLIETNEFAIELWDLPMLTNEYSQFNLKAELWKHIENVIIEEP